MEWGAPVLSAWLICQGRKLLYLIEFAYELIGIFIRDIDFHYFILWTGRSGYPKSEDGRVVIWKAVNICCYFRICLFAFFFFAAEGAVAWDIALSLEIPTVDGKRLMIPDDIIFVFQTLIFFKNM